MKTKIGLGVFILLSIIPLISSGNLSIFPNPGLSEAGNSILYSFNFSNSTNCLAANIILNHTEVVEINSRGFGYVSVNISNLSQVPTSLCEYKDGTLRKNHSYSDIIFNTIFARNLNLSENLKVLGNSSFNGTLMPMTTLTFDIGSGANRWGNIYGTNLSIDYIDVLNDLFVGGINLSGNLSLGSEIFMSPEGFIVRTAPGGSVRLNITIGGDIYTAGTFDNDGNTITSATFTVRKSRALPYLITKIDNEGITIYDNSASDNVMINLTTTGNYIGVGNMSIDGYYSGQPIDGSIGSGILNSSRNLPCGCINVTDDGVLDVTYPNLKVRIWDLDGTTIYCDIPSASPTVPDDAHTVYYIDNACTVQTMTWANYFAQDRDPADWARIFDVYAVDGDIEIIKGASVIGLTDRRTKFANVNCGGSGHLDVCDGLRASRSDTFPELNLSSGHFEYVHTIVPSEQRDSNPDGIHLVCESDGSHTAETEIDIDKCDDGGACNACPTNQYRRYIIFNIGWGTHTRLHQLAPLDGDVYTNLANCLNTEKYELSYTLPAITEGVAVPLAFYCGKRDDTAWTDGWVDIRMGREGFGASPDLSGFMTYEEWSQNANANNYNITGINWLEATTLNVTGTAYIGELTWNGNLNLSENNITNINKIFALDWSNVTITESQVTDLAHTIDTSADINCSTDEVFLGNGSCISSATLGDNSTWNQSLATTLYSLISEPLWSANQSLVYLKSNPDKYWNATFALFNKTYADTLYLTSVAYGDLTGNPSDVITAGNYISWTGDTLNVASKVGDADTLDTIDSGSFLRSDEADVWNDAHAAIDFRMESDTNENMFFLDGSANGIGIGTNLPRSPLYVKNSAGALVLAGGSAYSSDTTIDRIAGTITVNTGVTIDTGLTIFYKTPTRSITVSRASGLYILGDGSSYNIYSENGNNYFLDTTYLGVTGTYFDTSGNLVCSSCIGDSDVSNTLTASVAPDHGAGTTALLSNVVYSDSACPAAGGTTIGTICVVY